MENIKSSLLEIREKRVDMLTLSELITEIAILPDDIRNANIHGKDEVEKLTDRYHLVKDMIDGFYGKKIRGY